MNIIRPMGYLNSSLAPIIKKPQNRQYISLIWQTSRYEKFYIEGSEVTPHIEPRPPINLQERLFGSENVHCKQINIDHLRNQFPILAKLETQYDARMVAFQRPDSHPSRHKWLYQVFDRPRNKSFSIHLYTNDQLKRFSNLGNIDNDALVACASNEENFAVGVFYHFEPDTETYYVEAIGTAKNLANRGLGDFGYLFAACHASLEGAKCVNKFLQGYTLDGRVKFEKHSTKLDQLIPLLTDKYEQRLSAGSIKKIDQMPDSVPLPKYLFGMN